MLKTPLEHHSSLSKTTESLMLVIKASTVDERCSPNSPSSYGKVNKTFAHFVVELLVVNLLFDCWFNHSSHTSPAPYSSKVPDEIYRDLTTNRDLIVSYCIRHELGSTGMFDLSTIILYLLTVNSTNLYVFWLVTHQFALIVIIFIQIECLNNVVMFNSYLLNLRTFNLYAFLSSICIYLIYLPPICIFDCQG
jgi:hypothetical protein